jgi:hypothetical protein
LVGIIAASAGRSTDGGGHRLVHAYDFICLDKLDAAITLPAPAATLQLRHNFFRLADQDDA